MSIQGPSLILAGMLSALLGSCHTEAPCDCSVVPYLLVDPSRIEFNNVPVGTTVAVPANLTNAGRAPLVISNVSVPGGSDVHLDTSNILTTDCMSNTRSGNLDTLASGECARVVIQFSPTSAETVTTKLEITSDDPRSPTTTIPIVASTSTPDAG